MGSDSKRIRLCKICNCKTEHISGNYKTIQKGGDLFEGTSSLSEDLKDFGQNFMDDRREQGSYNVDRKAVFEHVLDRGCTPEDGNPLGKAFSARIKALKCVRCGHLIPLPRLP